MSSGGNAHTHVTVIGILNILWGSFAALAGLMMVFMAAVFATFFTQFVPFGLGALPSVMFAFLGALGLALGGLFIAAGAGLIGRRGWARIVALVGAGFAALFALGSLIAFEVFGLLINGGYAAYAFWALTRPEVVGQFAAPRPQYASA